MGQIPKFVPAIPVPNLYVVKKAHVEELNKLTPVRPTMGSSDRISNLSKIYYLNLYYLNYVFSNSRQDIINKWA